jgi:hypothetical protein
VGAGSVKTTRYFDEQVLRKRPYRRIRFWGTVVDPRDGKTRSLRIVTLADGQTVHNAFFDRDFKIVTP